MFASFRTLGRTLIDGLRAAILLPPRPAAFDTGLPVAVALAVLFLAALALAEFMLGDGRAEFNVPGVLLRTLSLTALVFYVALIPLLRTRAEPARMVTGVLSLSAILLLLASLALGGFRLVQPKFPALTVAPPDLAFRSVVTFLVVLGLTTLRLGFGLAQRLRLLAGVGLVATVSLAAVTFPNAPVFLSPATAPSEFSLLQTAVDWARPEPEVAEAEPPRPRIDAETAMTRQPELLAAALAQLQPPRENRAEYYFLGFAPFASQDVFKREITAVRALFDDRFGTAGRSLALINHRDTVQDLPLASMTNLNAALLQIGRLMRPARDVLVLFVTSHGTKGRIAVEFPGFPLNGLTPDRLAAALDRAGIVNRVLVLSACHAGSFVERLKTDTSLILAAAHADKTSFGCSNENEWTYFGDAYFNRALRTETSLVDAFATARDLIATWEKADNLEPSEPQIFVGSRIKSTLDAIEADRQPH